jgi:hypothetical protein
MLLQELHVRSHMRVNSGEVALVDQLDEEHSATHYLMIIGSEITPFADVACLLDLRQQDTKGGHVLNSTTSERLSTPAKGKRAT